MKNPKVLLGALLLVVAVLMFFLLEGTAMYVGGVLAIVGLALLVMGLKGKKTGPAPAPAKAPAKAPPAK